MTRLGDCLWPGRDGQVGPRGGVGKEKEACAPRTGTERIWDRGLEGREPGWGRPSLRKAIEICPGGGQWIAAGWAYKDPLEKEVQ